MGPTKKPKSPKLTRKDKRLAPIAAKSGEKKGNVAARRKREVEEEERAKSSGANRGEPWSDELDDEWNESFPPTASPPAATLTPTGEQTFKQTDILPEVLHVLPLSLARVICTMSLIPLSFYLPCLSTHSLHIPSPLASGSTKSRTMLIFI
jgi:hypothetical protein